MTIAQLEGEKGITDSTEYTREIKQDNQFVQSVSVPYTTNLRQNQNRREKKKEEDDGRRGETTSRPCDLE